MQLSTCLHIYFVVPCATPHPSLQVAKYLTPAERAKADAEEAAADAARRAAAADSSRARALQQVRVGTVEDLGASHGVHVDKLAMECIILT